MTKNFLKTLGAVLVAAGLIFAGVVAPAHAATALNLSSSSIATSTATANNFSIELTGATITSGTDTILIGPGPGWSVVNTCPVFANRSAASNCGISSVQFGLNSVLGWTAYLDGDTGPKIRLYKSNAGSGLTSETTIKVTFSAAAWTSPSSATFSTFSIQTYANGGATQDSASASFTVGSPTSTVTFNANGGSGTMANQTSGSAANLNANTYTKAGYTFGGWASSLANANAGTVFRADQASYSFVLTTTLYAIWVADSSGGGSSTPAASDATLPSTGFNGMPYLATGGVLALAGAVIILFARRRQDS